MLTLFTTAKAFEGHCGIIQRNALKSWTLLAPEIEIILFGDDRGAGDVCSELGIRSEQHVERHSSGMKYASYIFERAQAIASHDILCYCNCDILLSSDFLRSVNRVATDEPKFLMVGRRWDTDITSPIDFGNPSWWQNVRDMASQANHQRDQWFIDYFAFRRGLYRSIPDMVIGRVYWDNWLLWCAGKQGAAVVDASSEVLAIHQNHDYGYHKQGKTGVWNDELAQRNLQLAGGRAHVHSMCEANYVLTQSGLEHRSWGARFLSTLRDDWRNLVWHPFLNFSRPLRHAMGLRLRPAGGAEQIRDREKLN